MKKIIALVLALVLIFSFMTVLTGCEEKNIEAEKTGVVLRYLNWNLGTVKENNIERQMLKEFTKRTGHEVKVVELASEQTNYNEFLTGLAAQSNMPDVVMMNSIPYALENEWMADISEYTEKDPDWKKIPKVVEQSTHYNNKTYAIPAGYFMQGYIANDELFEVNNLDPLEFGFEYDEFIDDIKKLSNVGKKIIGLQNENNLLDWYASSKNQDLGWYTWDGSKYHLDAPEFKEALLKMKDIRTGKYSYDSLSETERAAMGGTIDRDVWNAGKMGLYWTNTADVPKLAKESKFEKRFVGIPGGRSSIVGDYMGVSPDSRHIKEAYELAKWMSFDPAGIQKRLELDKTGKQFNSLPLTTDKATIDKYFAKERNTFPGLEEAFKEIDSCIVEGVKVIPGYLDSRWTAKTGKALGSTTNATIGDVYTAAWFGQISYGDYATDINKLANSSFTKAVENIEKIY